MCTCGAVRARWVAHIGAGLTAQRSCGLSKHLWAAPRDLKAYVRREGSKSDQHPPQWGAPQAAWAAAPLAPSRRWLQSPAQLWPRYGRRSGSCRAAQRSVGRGSREARVLQDIERRRCGCVGPLHVALQPKLAPTAQIVQPRALVRNSHLCLRVVPAEGVRHVGHVRPAQRSPAQRSMQGEHDRSAEMLEQQPQRLCAALRSVHAAAAAQAVRLSRWSRPCC